MLTSRVAYLVQHHRYRPNEIVAVTFTNKAANEMKKRLQVLLGAREADMLILGKLLISTYESRADGEAHSMPHAPGISDDMVVSLICPITSQSLMQTTGAFVPDHQDHY